MDRTGRHWLPVLDDSSGASEIGVQRHSAATPQAAVGQPVCSHVHAQAATGGSELQTLTRSEEIEYAVNGHLMGGLDGRSTSREKERSGGCGCASTGGSGHGCGAIDA